MGKKSRDKGANFERQIAATLREHWPEARRRGNAQADGRQLEADVEGVPGWHIECKRYASPPSWAQCARWFADMQEGDRRRLLIVKADRRPAMVYLDRGHGLVCQPFADWLDLERPPLVKCPHGADPIDCNACYVLSDFAYDCARENR